MACLPLFNELYAAQPVRIETAAGKWIDGVVAGLSVHLQPGRSESSEATELENFYVDIGASSPQKFARPAWIFSSPLAINRRMMNLANQQNAGAVGRRPLR